MARGSICEVQTQLTIARELDYGSPETLTKAEELSYEVNKMLVTILKKLVAAGTSAG
jgi:four helix bundle protein